MLALDARAVDAELELQPFARDAETPARRSPMTLIVMRSTGVLRLAMMSMTSTAEQVAMALSSVSTGPGASLAPASMRCVRPGGPGVEQALAAPGHFGLA